MKRAAIFLFVTLLSLGSFAQEEQQPAPGPDGSLFAPSVWDLQIGEHAADLPTAEFAAFACGTDGGPPSRPLADWRGYDLCRPEPESGLHEVYFEYDNELELWAKANELLTQALLYEYTSAYEIPIIASALFDDRGFMVGLRVISDPRVPVDVRQRAITLSGFLRARYGVDGWSCTDLAPLEDESPYLGFFEKRVCERTDETGALRLVLETHNYRKPGQRAFDAAGQQLTTGQFRSETRLEVTLIGDVEDAEARLAEIDARGTEPTEKELRIASALDCPGCDFAGVDFKRADLTNANLAGANLAGANLHEAVLRGANLAGANLDSANLNGADVRLANLTEATLRDAMMYQAAFDGADLTGANLSRSLAGYVTMAGASLVGAVAITTDFINARINDADFTGADLRGSRFNDAQMTRSDFTDAVFNQAVMQRANLRGAILADADIKAVDLLRADLADTDLTGADFSFSRLTFAVLSGAEIEGAIWVEAQLPGGFEPN